MTKALIAALFLSQAPIADVRVFHDTPQLLEYIDYDAYAQLVSTRRVHTIHVSGAGSITSDLSRENFTTPQPPVPFYQIWDNGLNQTAIQFVGILSVIQQNFGAIDQPADNPFAQAIKKRILERVLRRDRPFP